MVRRLLNPSATMVEKALIIQNAARSQQQERLKNLSKLMDPLNPATRSGGRFIPERAEAASSFQKWSLSGDVQGNFAALMSGAKSKPS